MAEQRFTARNGHDTWVVSTGSSEFGWPPTITCEKGYRDSFEVTVDEKTGEFVFETASDNEGSRMVWMPAEAWTAFVEAVQAWRIRRESVR